jgi:hypothetical protein
MSEFASAASRRNLSRRKHEKEQSVFAPSLRQEIERGSAQIDFEISTATSGIAWRNAARICLAAILMGWEAGRLNGDPLPWEVLWMIGGLVVATFVALLPASRQAEPLYGHLKPSELDLLGRVLPTERKPYSTTPNTADGLARTDFEKTAIWGSGYQSQIRESPQRG